MENKKFYNIEQFTEADQEAVQQMALEITTKTDEQYGVKGNFDWKDIKKVYQDAGGMFYVVKKDNEVIGCAGVEKLNDEIAEFGRGRIKEEYRDKGIFNDLFDKAIQFSKSNNFKKIEARAPAPAMQHLLEKYGFVKTREEGPMFFYEKNI